MKWKTNAQPQDLNFESSARIAGENVRKEF